MNLPEPVHFLDGLRCPNCLAPDASRLRFLSEVDAAAVVECHECGAVTRVQLDQRGEAA